MYMTVSDFCQFMLVIIGAVGATIALMQLMHNIKNKKK